ncbi:MAG: hypothetical protein R3C56_15830 [Pirellulaceae bacterium]
MRLAEFPRHEELALHADLRFATCRSDRTGVERRAGASCRADRIDAMVALSHRYCSLLSGPVDIDKLDYLQRDSLHAGVPYGRNFDVNRLVSSLCVGQDGKSLAITEKGKTAAEMMVFARYVMFSEVYWHHTVRSATAMLQRLVYDLRSELPSQQWLCLTESEFGDRLKDNAAKQPSTQPLGRWFIWPPARFVQASCAVHAVRQPERVCRRGSSALRRTRRAEWTSGTTA